jgi:hypothetical protein
MSLPTYDEAFEHAADEPAFSNGTEGYEWMGNWCDRCVHDKPARQDDPGNGCPLILVAMMSRTPAEWIEQERFGLADRYHCVLFRDEDDPGGREPVPVPDPPGQLLLLSRDGYEGTRMYADTKPAEVTA